MLWTKSDIHIWNHAQLAAGSWHVRFDGEIATACRPAPSNTEVWILACVSGRPPLPCSMDWWAHQEQGWLLLRRKEHTAFDPVLPLSQTERESLVRQMRHTRPGPSSFKLLFLSLFPAWLQELFWQLLDIQRLSALVSPSLKKAIQVHMPKPNGGFRALSMLEEAFKALEGPVTKRLVSKRVAHNQPYSHTNLAYVPHFNAAAEVLYVDVLVCEDAALHEQPFCRIPSDYEKFFNTLHLPQIDSVLQARGVPDSARRFYAAAFQGHRLQLETKFGLTPEVAVQRGVMQGGVSSPELSRPAQDPILRLREQSSAVYTTSHGRRVATAGFSDDAEHYGSGVADIPTVVSELGQGSIHTGIGFAWGKFSAFATDWDDSWRMMDPATGISSDGIAVTSFDIWAGGTIQSTLQRTLPNVTEVLLGKATAFSDKHTLAAAELVSRLRQALRRLSQHRASWDERVAFFQWVMRGTISYVPLVGLPSPLELHHLDTAFQNLVLSGMGVRSTVERMSLLAAKRNGGMQIPSVVESLLAATSADLIVLLSGSTIASVLARDALREAMFSPPAQADSLGGMVVLAIRLLAHYGLHINVQTDRFLSRVLDALPCPSHQPLVGPFRAAAASPSLTLARVGFVANTLRCILQSWTEEGRPTSTWPDEGLWAQALPIAFPFSSSQCSAAVNDALAKSRLDWTIECSLFRPDAPPPPIPENWPVEEWEVPTMHGGARAAYLDAACPFLTQDDFAMYSDGSEKGLSQCSFAAQARSFSRTVSAPMASRLPAAYGHERCSIHTAELMGMLSALRYAKPGAWNLFVGDRSSLFSLITKLSDGPLLKAILRSANIPLASRLSGILARLQVAWPGTPPLPPAWRMHQTMHPHKWNVQQLLLARPAWYSQIASCNYGLVGVDVRSHQSGEPIPMRIIVAGNEAQDQACNAAMSLPRPTPVSLPTGGTFAYISYHGAMVTSSARDAVRDLLRCQALDEWKLRPVQGKVATLTALVYTPALDMHLYSCLLSQPIASGPTPTTRQHFRWSFSCTLPMPSPCGWGLDRTD